MLVRPTTLLRTDSVESPWPWCFEAGPGLSGGASREESIIGGEGGGSSAEALISRAMELLDSNQHNMSKYSLSLVRDLLLGLDRISRLESSVAYMEGSVDERLSMKSQVVYEDRETELLLVVRDSVNQVVSEKGTVRLMW